MAKAGEGGEGERQEEDTLGEYWGKRNKNNERHGDGWARLPNGDIYVGTYARGKRNGRGVYVFIRNGARYDGEWRKGTKYGQGVFFYPDGSRYEGEWKRDYRHGFGAYYYTNGDVYEGSWYKNARHGLGTYIYNSTGAKFMGTWIKGKMEGPAQLIFPPYRFHGSWSGNLPLGRGVFVFEMKCMQHGNFIHVKDPEYQGESGETPENQTEPPPTLPKGILPVWRAYKITEYAPELLPPEPVPIHFVDSLESLSEAELSEAEEPYGLPIHDMEEALGEDDGQWAQGDTTDFGDVKMFQDVSVVHQQEDLKRKSQGSQGLRHSSASQRTSSILQWDEMLDSGKGVSPSQALFEAQHRDEE